MTDQATTSPTTAPPAALGQTKPTVLIVGAGLAGLLLGLLLEKIKVPYHIYERAVEVRPLGSVMTLGANILPVFEQLGLLEELYKISLPLYSAYIYSTDMKQVGFLDGKGQKELTGYDMLAFSRPKLYDLMRKQVPVEKISMNKKVIRIEEVPSEDKIRIYCVDNSHYEGHILVGADGAYSGVRKSLYKQLDEKGVLPKEDLDNFKMAYVNLVGVADFKDRGNDQTNEKYPQLKDNFGTFAQILGHDNRSWGVRNVADKQICWSLSAQVAEPESQGLNINNAEWGPEANEAMIKQFENEPCPWGGKMGDLIEATPKNLISKVVLEDKLFKTWYHGRTVLIGDAAHKMLPGGAQGAINAMQDAVVLANSIFALTDLSFKNITAAFETYYHQRYSRAGGHVKRSSVMSQLMAGQTWTDRTIRHVMFNYIPEWIHQWSLSKTAEYRPQLAWLPLAPNRGKGNVSPQECVRKELEETAQAI